jgi:hypothetical protein
MARRTRGAAPGALTAEAALVAWRIAAAADAPGDDDAAATGEAVAASCARAVDLGHTALTIHAIATAATTAAPRPAHFVPSIISLLPSPAPGLLP